MVRQSRSSVFLPSWWAAGRTRITRPVWTDNQRWGAGPLVPPLVAAQFGLLEEIFLASLPWRAPSLALPVRRRRSTGLVPFVFLPLVATVPAFTPSRASSRSFVSFFLLLQIFFSIWSLRLFSSSTILYKRAQRSYPHLNSSRWPGLLLWDLALLLSSIS